MTNRDESNRPTIADALTLIFGFAIFFTIQSQASFVSLPFYTASIPFWFLAAFFLLSLSLMFCGALSIAVARRTFVNNRYPSSGEWLALLVTAATFSQGIPNVDTTISYLWEKFGEFSDFEPLRWQLAGIALVIAISLVLVATRIPKRFCLILLVPAALCYFWGPCTITEQQFGYLFYGLTITEQDGLVYWLVGSSIQMGSRMPLIVVFVVPFVAFIRQWKSAGRRSLRWTELGGAGNFVLIIMVVIVIVTAMYSGVLSTEYVTTALMLVVAVALTGLLSWFVLKRIGIRSDACS